MFLETTVYLAATTQLKTWKLEKVLLKKTLILNDIENMLNTKLKFEEIKGELKSSTDDSKKVSEFQSLFRCALFAILQHQTVTLLVYSVGSTWDAIIAFVTWIVAQSAAKVLNVAVARNFLATQCLFLVLKIFWKYQALEKTECVKIHEMKTIVFRQWTRYQWHCQRNGNKLLTHAHRRFLWSNYSDHIL